MSFTETLVSADEKILLAINGNHTPFLDGMMYYLSEKWILIPVYLLLIYFLKKNYGWKFTGYVLIFALVMVGLSDVISSYLFKNTISRLRPSHEPGIQEQLHYVYNYRGGEYGFYSSHASNMTALALYCGFFLKQKVRYYSIFAFIMVFVICLSRVYLGVHYPSDILAGCFAGTVISFVTILVFKNYITPKIQPAR